MERWERSVNDDEEELDIAKQAEQKQMSEIDKDMRKLEGFKTEKMSKKNDLDNMDEEIAKVRVWCRCFPLLMMISIATLSFPGPTRRRKRGQRAASRPESHQRIGN